MEWYEVGGLFIGMVIALMALGVPVAFAFLAVSAIGVMIVFPPLVGLKQLAANATAAVTKFALIPIPLFLLMGELFFHTGVAARVFDAFDALFGRPPQDALAGDHGDVGGDGIARSDDNGAGEAGVEGLGGGIGRLRVVGIVQHRGAGLAGGDR